MPGKADQQKVQNVQEQLQKAQQKLQDMQTRLANADPEDIEELEEACKAFEEKIARITAKQGP